MKSRTFFPPLIPLLALVLAHSASGEISLEDSIQPRTGESRWDYTSYYFYGEQMVPGGTAMERVVEVREIEGVEVFRVEFLIDWRGFWERLVGTPLTPEDYSYYWEYFDEAGSHNFSEDYEDPQPPVSLSDFALTIPYPVEKGHKYDAEETDYEVVAVDREVAVPAGTFETVVYEMTNRYSDDPADVDRQRYFMAPGVGLVRWEMDVLDEQGNWVLDARDDLFSFSLESN